MNVQKVELDQEWIDLIKEALNQGITKQEILDFLKKGEIH